MKLRSFKYIKKEDVKQEFRPIVDNISPSINDLGQDVTQLANNNVNITDNLRQELKSVTLTVNSSGVPTARTLFQSKFNNTKVQGILVIRVENLTNNTYPSSGVLISFSQNNNFITIDHVTGLLANIKYKLTFITIID